jgi:SAM-dependent methyltransferase
VSPRIDEAALTRMLANEADMAARRRVRVVLEYLDIGPDDLVLDCGCGLGWFLHVIGKLTACRLTGTDYDVPRLASAQRALNGRAPLAASDILALPYADATFDKIVLSEVLEHLPDDAGALTEVVRVLKPGGLLAVTVPNEDYPLLWDPVNWTRESLGLKPITQGFFGGLWTDHKRLYRRADIVALVRSAGMEVEDSRQFVHHCFPFAHNLVYGLGMRLVQSGLVPQADRFAYASNTGRWWSPLSLGRRVFDAIDRWNDPVSDEGRTTVILSVKARKPASR